MFKAAFIQSPETVQRITREEEAIHQRVAAVFNKLKEDLRKMTLADVAANIYGLGLRCVRDGILYGILSGLGRKATHLVGQLAKLYDEFATAANTEKTVAAAHNATAASAMPFENIAVASKLAVDHGTQNADKILTIISQNPGLLEAEGGLAGAAREVIELDQAIDKANEILNTSHQMVGSGSTLRKVEFFKGLSHAKLKHFFGKGEVSLKTLDPKGNAEKWISHIIGLAQRGTGTITTIPSGQMLEVMGTMPKTASNDILRVGVRLFKANGTNSWKLNTILTAQ